MDLRSISRTSVTLASTRAFVILQANAEAEQFMRVLKQLYQISKLTGSTFKQGVYRFLGAYRATPHCTTKFAPADLMYPGRTFGTRLPI